MVNDFILAKSGICSLLILRVLKSFNPKSSLSIETVAFKSSINKVADKNDDSTLLIMLFALIS